MNVKSFLNKVFVNYVLNVFKFMPHKCFFLHFCQLFGIKELIDIFVYQENSNIFPSCDPGEFMLCNNTLQHD